jgi:hypothetical protein
MAGKSMTKSAAKEKTADKKVAKESRRRVAAGAQPGRSKRKSRTWASLLERVGESRIGEKLFVSQGMQE